ncbi:hypothetical protein ACVIJW_007045 [Bradyrhizobium barranii subsp. barranii]
MAICRAQRLIGGPGLIGCKHLRADGEALAGREDRARSKPRRPRCRAPASLRGCRRRSLRSLAADLAADLRQIKLAEAIRYAVSRRAIFERFLLDGRIELDSNIVERAIRPQTITRKNSLFAGSDGGGRTWATIATLLQTADFTDREHRFRAIVSTEFRRS